MREHLIDQGLDPSQVIAETESTNTDENLRFSRTVLSASDSPVIVVTSSYHAFRTALLTRSLGMNAHVIGSPTTWYYLPSATLREFVGVIREHRRVHILFLILLIALATLFTITILPMGAPPQ